MVTLATFVGRLMFLIVPSVVAWTSTSRTTRTSDVLRHTAVTGKQRISTSVVHPTASVRQSSCRLFAFQDLFGSSKEEEDEDDDDWNNPVGGGSLGGSLGGAGGFPFGQDEATPEQSSSSGNDLINFAEQFLDRQKKKERGKDSLPTFTHCIAIPLDKSFELAVQLESVQKAILYECPFLVRSCILASKLRLPLLYVDASSSTKSTLRPSTNQISKGLAKLVETLVQKHFFVPPSQEDADDNSFVLNEEGLRPVALDFHKLVVRGTEKRNRQHEVLSTKAVKPSRNDVNKDGYYRLLSFLEELEKHVRDVFGYAIMRPTTSTSEHDALEVPFMRLPDNFEKTLAPPSGPDGIRTPEEGGDGISPSFFFQYWDEVFGRNIRLSSVGIYACATGTSTHHLTETSFPRAVERIPLPKPSRNMAQIEREHEEYNKKRMMEAAEYAMKEFMGPGADRESLLKKDDGSSDALSSEMKDTRAKLEALFEKDTQRNDLWADDEPTTTRRAKDPTTTTSGTSSSPLTTQDDHDNMGTTNAAVVNKNEGQETEPNANILSIEDYEKDQLYEDLAAPGIVDAMIDDDDDDKIQGDFPPVAEDDPIPDWMQQRMRKIVESRNQEKERQKRAFEVKARNVDPDGYLNNPILKAHREGTFMADEEEEVQKKERELPPYPAKEHFIGFWRTVQSPMMFLGDVDDDTTSDNLVLKADGTVSGGPILNLEVGHRAGGGTWEVKTVTSSNDDDNDEVRVHIRLVIPPERAQIMVLDGLVMKRSDLPSVGQKESTLAGSLLKGADFLDNAFNRDNDEEAEGEKTLEQKKTRNVFLEGKEEDDDDDFLTCRGRGWIEDADTGANRKYVGTFLFHKLNVSTDRRDYVITMPGKVRDLD